MKPITRNRIVWLGVLAVIAAIWFLAVRPGLHFIDPVRFLIIVASAALALAALLWWEIAGDRVNAAPPYVNPSSTGGKNP